MTAVKTKLFGLILAGGSSQRMGEDKSLLKFHGKPQIEYVHSLLKKHCAKIFLSKRADQKIYQRLTAIDDIKELNGMGPLSGICSAMNAYPQASWLVVACDLPFVTQETLDQLIRSRDPKKFATAFISAHDGLPEPLCALWEHGNLDLIKNLLKKGVYCPRKVLIKNNTHLIAQTNPHWLDNINTPLEYEEAKKFLRGEFKI